MRRYAALLLCPLVIGCFEGVKPDPDAAELRAFNLLWTEQNTKPAVPQPVEPAEPAQMDPSCPELLKTISDAAGPCKMEQLATGDDDCTPKTCPECARMVAAETQAKALGCLPK